MMQAASVSRRRALVAVPAFLALFALLRCGAVKSPTEPAAAPHAVDVSNFQFSPRELTVHVGDTVTWTNRGGFHNVSADDGSFRCAEGCGGTAGDPSSATWTFMRTFSTPGRVPYYCEVHGGPGGNGMSGTIVVAP